MVDVLCSGHVECLSKCLDDCWRRQCSTRLVCKELRQMHLLEQLCNCYQAGYEDNGIEYIIYLSWVEAGGLSENRKSNLQIQILKLAHRHGSTMRGQFVGLSSFWSDMLTSRTAPGLSFPPAVASTDWSQLCLTQICRFITSSSQDGQLLPYSGLDLN